MLATRLTEKELTSLLQNNPNIQVTINGKRLQAANIPTAARSKRNKLGNVKVYIYDDGTVSHGVKLSDRGKLVKVYDSIKEYNRSLELKLMSRAGIISDLREQVKFEIQPKFETSDGTVRDLNYKADFSYIRDGKRVVEDVKPFDKRTNRYRYTKDFKIKWKLLQYMHPEYVFEIY